MMIKKYTSSLDGVRGLAVLLVIFSHWPFSRFTLPFGWMGVNLFFVLSGYLITANLLHNKENSFQQYYFKFYKNRVLRIFPVYFGYLVVVTTVLLSLSQSSIDIRPLAEAAKEIRLVYPYLITFTYNFVIIINEFKSLGWKASFFFGHFWSLAVEQQFYLFFPIVTYYFSKQRLKGSILLIIFLCPLARLYFAHFCNFSAPFVRGSIIYVSTFSQADALATGALLAIIPLPNLPNINRWLVILILSLAVIVYLLLSEGNLPLRTLGLDFPGMWISMANKNNVLNYRITYLFSIINFITFFLIAHLINNGLLKSVFEIAPLRKIGQISFGLYVYHFPILAITTDIFNNYNQGKQISAIKEVLLLTLFLATSIMISQISFKYLEKAFLKLKYQTRENKHD